MRAQNRNSLLKNVSFWGPTFKIWAQVYFTSVQNRYKTIISAPRRGNGYMRHRRRARLTSLIGRGHTRSNRVCPRPIRRTAARRQAAAGTPLGRPAWRCSTRRTAASMSAPAAGATSGLAVLSLHNRAQPRPPTHWRRVNSMIWSCCSPVSGSCPPPCGVAAPHRLVCGRSTSTRGAASSCL